MIHKRLHQKLKIWQQEPETRVKSDATEGQALLAPQMALAVYGYTSHADDRPQKTNK